MPAKKADKAAAIAKASKSKKKKWSKGKSREKLAHDVLFQQKTLDKLIKEVPAYKLITPYIVADRLKVNGSMARAGIRELEKRGLIKRVIQHKSNMIYTRNVGGADEAAEGVSAPIKEEEEEEGSE